MSPLHTLLAQKSWSDNELFDRLATVAAPEHAAMLHTAVRMLNHIHVVDRIFQAHLQGEPHGYTATNTEATPELAELQFAVAEVDGWYLQYVQRVTEAELRQAVAFRFTDGDPGTMTREEMLLHVVTHGAYHRGNVGQMLRSIGLAPPRDLLTRFLHVSEPQRRWS
jgi:uncharacterized damage-inducible protein DinB